MFLTDGTLERNATSVGIRTLMVEGAQMHPREAVQHVVLALLEAADGALKDDATAMCVDWHGRATARARKRLRRRSVGSAARVHRDVLGSWRPS